MFDSAPAFFPPPFVFGSFDHYLEMEKNVYLLFLYVYFEDNTAFYYFF